MPQRVDSLLVRYASRSYMDDLLSAGVHIRQFTGGLLHTKSLVIDRSFSLFGSVNLDMRSLRLNYEITLMVYDPVFSAELRALQDRYLAKAPPWTPRAGHGFPSTNAWPKTLRSFFRPCFKSGLSHAELSPRFSRR